MGEVYRADPLQSNVCRVYDIAEVPSTGPGQAGQQYLSMEYVDGEDLSSLLRRIGRLPRDKAMQIARQLRAGVQAAHAQGILRPDLKPANVMIDGRGQMDGCPPGWTFAHLS